MRMLSKADADAVRSQNRRLAIDHFRHFPVSTRRRLSDETGLSLSAASAITSDLARETILCGVDVPDVPTRRGRPEVSLAVRGGACSVMVLKISVGEARVSIADYAGRVLVGRTQALDLAGLTADDFLQRMRELISACQNDVPASAGPLRRGVVSIQGVTDATSRSVLWSPILKIRDLDMAEPLETLVGVPFEVLNDCGVMPERFRWERRAGVADFATLFMGFGVGMGLRLSGATFRGSRSSAVEFGHLNHIPGGDPCRCGNLGCIEAYAGDYAIWRHARGQRFAPYEQRIPDEAMQGLADDARGGDVQALSAFTRAGEAIGYGLGRMFTLIDPLPVVFVGSSAGAMDLMEAAIRQGIRESAIEGIGEDVSFTVIPNADALLLEASIVLALSAVDGEISRNAAFGLGLEAA